MIDIMPPKHKFTRARRWETFERLFKPITHEDYSLIWQVGSVPKDADPHHWWTVLDPMTGTLYLVPGFHFVNRLGYIRCENRWAGDQFQHPEYIY